MTTAGTEPTPKATKAGALHRDIGLLDATMLVMGAMIGSGIFITSAESKWNRSSGLVLLPLVVSLFSGMTSFTSDDDIFTDSSYSLCLLLDV